MSISNALKDELYKLTEEYKQKNVNSSLIYRYIFKPSNQENKEPKGSFSFIDSDKLYDFNDDIYNNKSDDEKKEYEKSHPDIRTYFKYNSIAGRFLNKHVRVCDLPISILQKSECPICRLSKNSESILTNNDFGTENFPLNIFGNQYNTYDFLSKTGVLISVYKMTSNNDVYETYKIFSNDVKITILSSNYFDVSFHDSNPNFSYYIIEVCKICKTKPSNEDESDVNKICFGYTPNGYIYKSSNIFNNLNDDVIYYDKKYCKLVKYISLNTIKNSEGKNKILINMTDDDFENRYISKYQLNLWIKDNNKSMLIPSSYIYDFKINKNTISMAIDEINGYNSGMKFTCYCIYDEVSSEMKETTINDILSSYKIDDYISSPNTSTDTYGDDLIRYFPYYLRERLDEQSPTFFGKIETISRNNIINYLPDTGLFVPCIRFEVPMKHSSFMIFHHGKLLSPYAYFEGKHTITQQLNGNKYKITIGNSGNMYIYINLTDFASDEYDISILENKTIITLNEPIYMIISNNYFNEDVVFPLAEIDKYIPCKGSKFYNYIDDDYVITDNDGTTIGKYIKYEDDYYELYEKTPNKYYKSYREVYKTDDGKSRYKCEYIIKNSNELPNSSIEYFYKVRSYEYILPVNKRINKEKISIMIEQMLEVDDIEQDYVTGIKYAKDSVNDNKNMYWLIMINNNKRFVKSGDLNSDGKYSVIVDGIEYEPEMNNNKPITYKRVTYKYSTLLSDIKYYTESGSTELYVKNNDNYEKYIPDYEQVKALRNYNEILKFRIVNGEIIGSIPTDSEYLALINSNDTNNIELDSDVLNICDGKIVAYDISNGFSQYYLNDEDDEFLSYPIPSQLIASDNKLFAFIDGRLTDEFIIDKHLYYRLFDGNTMLAFSEDPIINDNDEQNYKKFRYDENGDYVFDPMEERYRRYEGQKDDDLNRYRKIISAIYLTNPGNYTLYQDIHGIEYDDGVFTISNNIDNCIIDQHVMYNEHYMVPFSTKYMILFINGYYIPSDHIKIISNRRFSLINIEDYLNIDNLEINEIFIYKYDYINPQKYNDYFINTTKYSECITHEITDYLWDEYLSNYDNLSKIKSTIKPFNNIIMNPKDPSFHSSNSLTAMYEIFGKYVLNKYDIDSDFELANEVRSYFNSLYDSDGRMRLELILDKAKRKYQY